MEINRHFASLKSLKLATLGLFVPVVSWAQPAQVTASEEQQVVELVAPARELAQQGRVTDAMSAILTAREKLEKMFGRADHWSLGYATDDLARYRRLARDFQGAYEASGEAVEIASHEFGKTFPFAYFAESNAALGYAAGYCKDARKSAETALNIYVAADAKGVDTQRAALTLSNFSLQRGDVAGALSTFQRTFGDAKVLNANISALALRIRLALAEGKLADAQTWLGRAEQAVKTQGKNAERFQPVMLFLRAQISNEAGNVAESERLLMQALNMPSLQTHRSEWLLALQQQALFQSFKGRYSESLAGYGKAFQEYAKEYSGNAQPLIALNRSMGSVYRAVGDFKRAEGHLTQALTAADSCYGATNGTSLYVLYDRAQLLIDAGRPNDALTDADRAVRDAEKMTADRELHKAYALTVRAAVRRRLGRPDEAQSDLAAALDIARIVRGKDTWDLASGYSELAEQALRKRELGRARELAQTALTIRDRESVDSAWTTGLPVVQLMDVAAARKDWREVAHHGERVVGLLQRRVAAAQERSDALTGELRRSRLWVERMLDDFADMPSGVFNSQNGMAQVFAAAQSPHLADSSAAMRLADQVVVSTPDQIKILAQRRALWDELQMVQSQLQGGSLGRQAMLSAETAQVLLRRSGEIEAELTSKDMELQKAYPQLADRVRPSLQSLSEVQALLGPDEALYLQLVTDNRTHGILLRANTAVYRSSQLNRAVVRRNVSLLRRAVDPSLPPVQRLPFDYKVSNELYAGTLGLFASELNGVHDLTVILDDAFQNLPPALLVKNVKKNGASGKASFLGETLGIAVQPSVDTLRTLRERDRYASATQAFIGFGNPALAGSRGEIRSANALANQSSGGTALADLQALPPLPETADELMHIAQGLASGDPTVYMQSAATETRVKSLDLSDYRVMGFATHGLLAGEFRGLVQPALVMTPPKEASDEDDGLLTAAEVASLKLKAEFIILPVFNTGRADEGGGASGLSALARGFFVAGADSLIASHWQVPSDAVVALVSETLRLMSADPTLSRAQALRQAMVRIMQGAAGEQFRNPAYWAPFVLIGDARPLATSSHTYSGKR